MKINVVGQSPSLLKDVIPHFHDYWEIVLNLEGEGITVIDGQEYKFYPGTIICQPPHVWHSKFSENKFKDIFIQVSDFAIPNNGDISIFTDDEEKSFESLMFMALRIFHKKDPNYISVVTSLYESMVQLLLSWSGNQHKNEFVELFKNDLIENFTNPEFQIGDAMKKNAYCNDHFRRCFKKETGMTPIAYLMNLKIEYAKKLLAQMGERRMTIADIALMAGFYDPRYFSRVFKTMVGSTPQEFGFDTNDKI